MLLKALTTDLMCEIPLILYVQTPAVDDIMAIRVCLCFLLANFFFPISNLLFHPVQNFCNGKRSYFSFGVHFLAFIKITCVLLAWSSFIPPQLSFSGVSTKCQWLCDPLTPSVRDADMHFWFLFSLCLSSRQEPSAIAAVTGLFNSIRHAFWTCLI